MQKFILFLIAVHFTSSTSGSEPHTPTSTTHKPLEDALPHQNESYNYEALMKEMDVLEEKIMKQIITIQNGCDKYNLDGEDLLKKLPKKPFKFFDSKAKVQITIDRKKDEERLKKSLNTKVDIGIIRQYIKTVRKSLSEEKDNPRVFINKGEKDPDKKIWVTKQTYLNDANRSIVGQLDNLINGCQSAVKIIEENLKLYEKNKPEKANK